MTREEAKEWIPIIQAFADGKTIEFFKQGEWYELNDPDFMWSAYKYRIKPEPKYRPFITKEECWTEMHKHPDFGWVLKSGVYLHILSLYKDALYIQEENDAIYFDNAFNELTFTDGTPFGIKEEQV